MIVKHFHSFTTVEIHDIIIIIIIIIIYLSTTFKNTIVIV